MKLALFMVSFLTAVLSGCVHHHGLEEQPVQGQLDKRLRVQIGSKEVATGEIVDILEEVCTPASIPVRLNPMKSTKCDHKPIGTGRVVEIIDHDSAIVEPQGEINVKGKLLVEKRK